jgi:hypothetical protein
VLRDDLALPWRNQVRSSTLSFLLLLQSSSPPGRFCSSLLRFSFSCRHLWKSPSFSSCRCWWLFAAAAAGGRSQHQHTHTHACTHTQLPDSPPIETPTQPAHTHTPNSQFLLRSRPQHSQHTHTHTPNSQFLLRSP